MWQKDVRKARNKKALSPIFWRRLQKASLVGLGVVIVALMVVQGILSFGIPWYKGDFVNLQQHHLPPAQHQFERTVRPADQVLAQTPKPKWYEAVAPPLYIKSGSNSSWGSPDFYRDRASSLDSFRQEFSLSSPSEKAAVDIRCIKLSQYEQMLDAECTGRWLTILKEGRITSIDKLWGFFETHNGAITFTINNRYKALFKPCSSKSEDTGREVLASHLDRVMQWGQAVPVIGRRISLNDLLPLVSRLSAASQRVYADTIAKCSRGGYMKGPMMGWIEGLIPVRTMRKIAMPVTELVEMRKDAYYVGTAYANQKQSKFHSFYWLVDILRHGKDEFITPEADLISLDLDRSKFLYLKSITSPNVNFTWCFTCHMDRWVYETLNAVSSHPDVPPESRLSNLLKTSLSKEELFPDAYTSEIGYYLDKRVESLLQCVTHCIKVYGESEVLLAETKPSSKSLVRYYVQNSEYKNRNGMKPPENIAQLLSE